MRPFFASSAALLAVVWCMGAPLAGGPAAPADGAVGSVAGSVNPYGVNCWFWNLGTINFLKRAGILHYRVMVPWHLLEPEPGRIVWDGAPGSPRSADLHFHAHNARAANRDTATPVRLSLVFYGSPAWARRDPQKVLSYDPERYAAFIARTLEFCDGIAPGLVEAVEVENEYPTGAWVDGRPPVFGTDQRDPSWYYADILKAASRAVKRHNPTVTVVAAGIWEFAHHQVDALYQLGCGAYFDRLNLHYYDQRDMGNPHGIRVPPWEHGWQHFPTHLGYLHEVARRHGDGAKLIRLTEFGWRVPERLKSRYLISVLDVCRLSGLVDRVNYYQATNFYEATAAPTDTIGFIDVTTFSEDEEFGWAPVSYRTRPLYDTFRRYIRRFPTWTAGSLPLHCRPVPAPSREPAMPDGSFDRGVEGWHGPVTATDGTAHLAVPGRMVSEPFAVEPLRLYEVSFRISIGAADADACHVQPGLEYLSGGADAGAAVINYWGVVDTRRYPDGWRTVRFIAVPPAAVDAARVVFDARGSGVVRIDDVRVQGLALQGARDTH